MKILFLTDNFPPEFNAPAVRTFEHCKKWVDLGAKVTVITCFPNFPKGEIYSGYKNKFYSSENINGIKVIRVWTYISSNSGFFKRIIDYLSFGLNSFLFGIFQNFDVVIGTSPQFFTAISARLISFFKRKPWIMEVRDIWPESIAAVGALKRTSTLYKILSNIEFHLYKSSTGIVVVTDSFKAYLLKLGILESKISVIKNGVIKFDTTKIGNKRSLFKELGIDKKFIISYIGTHGMAHALDFILDCISEIKDEDVHFIFQGDGSEKNKLISHANTLKLNNITFLPAVEKELIYEYINSIDVALINLKKSDTFKSVIPSKIFENILFKKPILLGVEGEAYELITKYKVGICYTPENKNSFLQSVKKIKTFKKNNFENNCDNLINDFERKKLASDMLDFLKKNTI